VEKNEKLAQRSRSPVHEHRLAFKVCNPPLQILLRKTLSSLFESDRGLLDLQFLYSKFGQLLFKMFEIIELKQRAGNTFGQGRRRATTSCAPCAASSRSGAGYPQRPHRLASRRSPPPEADRIPRLRSCRCRPHPTMRRGPHGATRRRTTRAVPAGHAPLRTVCPSASSRPRAPYYGRVSRRRHPRPASSLFKRRHFPPLRANRAAALHCRCRR
jgi:hypothetical protein